MTATPEQQIASLTATNKILLGVLKQAETVLGENLAWIADQADLGVRQKDAETLRRLEQLDKGWKLLLGAIAHAEKMALVQRMGG